MLWELIESDEWVTTMSEPRRIRRHAPPTGALAPDAVVVSRPSFWGNRYRVGDPGVPDAQTAVQLFRAEFDDPAPGAIEMIQGNLRGHDLACCCRLCDAHADGKPLGVECPDCEPCHADVLLEIANGGTDDD